jgi:hypothetical protein
VTERQIVAANQLCAAAAALGPERINLSMWSVLDDQTWGRIGKRIGLSDKTTVLRIVEALQALSAWFARQPVPPPPKTRPYNRPGRW